MANDVLPASSSIDHERARTSSQPSAFWFDDGSIIIAVARERFRLHKSLLSRHSSIFESLPVSQSTRAETRDPPTVEISEGLATPRDFTALLEHLYHDVYVLLLACIVCTILSPALALLRSVTSLHLYKTNRLCSTIRGIIFATRNI
ncbi:uncharacterized protein PHACADRAFT_191088 [Phanerochaete carnosa HHB-10118-sp]|uniref:BTB domain-containing protein n=1 Tax=Phanerochaete carnosa (strain HHB-10118-sp) TaxID=650164 RepID=K5WR07_PHACS|nr:uncharacterized protein PHACADRAFT_191088 [Phanerochaete carnosa HHB-10118-sp]EKM61895.1 hypothetical protein PHACADRAFT_191088 [Phanerochaete carnosa HHB-10118-sp]